MEANASMVLYEFFHFLIGFSLGNCEFARVYTCANICGIHLFTSPLKRVYRGYKSKRVV